MRTRSRPEIKITLNTFRFPLRLHSVHAARRW